VLRVLLAAKCLKYRWCQADAAALLTIGRAFEKKTQREDRVHLERQGFDNTVLNSCHLPRVSRVVGNGI